MDTNARRAAALTAAVVLAGALAACGSGGDEPQEQQATTAAQEESPAPEPAETEAAEPVLTNLPDAATIDELMSADVMKVDQMYVDRVRTEYPNETADIDDDMLTSIGHNACMAFDEGATPQDVTAQTLASGVDLEAGGYIVGGGLAVYCPEWLDEFGVDAGLGY